jgi:MoaA/NifB/PqqE/SkfB family radical SAM enzyme
MRYRDLVSISLTGMGRILGNRVLRRETPIVAGIALNDSCNLRCRHCRVANRGIPDMTMAEVNAGLRRLRAMGPRVLYIEGGEPFIWRDRELGLEDVIASARSLGFGIVIIYTNGTQPIRTSADAVYVSLDGLRDTNNRLRGLIYDQVLANIASSAHRNITINFTINRENEPEIERFCETMTHERNVRGLFFYFYTPGAPPAGEIDNLRLSEDAKAAIVDRLLRLKARGVPVRNSVAALNRVRNDHWTRPSGLCYLYAENRMYRCCRSIDQPEICRECGYLGYAELESISRFRLGPFLEAIRMVAGVS